MKNKLVSIIIPTYNEESVIGNCLTSLKDQSYNNVEIILVDDGSTDSTLEITSKLNIRTFKQKHQGPGPARNLGAKHAIGEILVFVDADMTFDKNFIEDLIKPILKNKTIGTFSKNEMNANKDNNWSKCWNINRGWPIDRLIPPNYPSRAPVFRAILKKEFDKVCGFDTDGQYTDDWSLSKKLKKESTLASGAIYYHSNPSTLAEIWKQARWIGKNSFISGNPLRRVRSLIRYSFPTSIIIGLAKTIINNLPQFLIFKITYDLAVFTSVLKSYLNEKKSK